MIQGVDIGTSRGANVDSDPNPSASKTGAISAARRPNDREKNENALTPYRSVHSIGALPESLYQSACRHDDRRPLRGRSMDDVAYERQATLSSAVSTSRT